MSYMAVPVLFIIHLILPFFVRITSKNLRLCVWKLVQIDNFDVKKTVSRPGNFAEILVGESFSFPVPSQHEILGKVSHS